MKQLLFLISLVGLMQFSCVKSKICSEPDACSSTNTSLDGKWRMIMVKDNISGSISTKPDSVERDVDITFTSLSATTGTFSGNTINNSIWLNNTYSTDSNKSLTIKDLYMTKAGEAKWGNEFVNNIRNSQEYSFEKCDKLNIRTTNKTLIFQRL